MKPPYEISSKAMQLLVVISEKIGVLGAYHLIQQSPKLRKENRIKTIQASLQIEGNTLTVDQVSAVMEKKPQYIRKLSEVLEDPEVYSMIALVNYAGIGERTLQKSFDFAMNYKQEKLF